MALALSLEITAETREAERGLERVERGVQSLGDKAKAADERLDAAFKELDKSLKTTEQDLQKATRAQGGFTDQIVRFASGVAIGAAIKATIAYADQINDLAAKAQISTTAMQKLAGAAEDNGSSIAAVTNGMAELQRRLQSADGGTIQALHRLNLNFETVKRLQPDQAFLAVAGAMERSNQKNRDANELFGRLGRELLPILNAEFVKATDNQLAMSEAAVKAGGTTNDIWNKVWRDMKTIGGEALGGMAAQLNDIYGVLSKALPFAQELARVFGRDFMRVGLTGGLYSMVRTGINPWAFADTMTSQALGTLPSAPGAPSLVNGVGVSDFSDPSSAAVKIAIDQLTEQARKTTRRQRDLENASDEAAQALWRQAQMARQIANNTGWLSQFPGGQWQLPTGGWNGGGGYLYTVGNLPPTGGASRFYAPGMSAPMFDPRTGASLLGPSANPLNPWGTPSGAGFSWGQAGRSIFGTVAPYLTGAIGGRNANMGGQIGGALGGVGAGLAASAMGLAGGALTALGTTMSFALPVVGPIVGMFLGNMIGKLFGPSRGAILGREADARLSQTREGLLKQYGSVDAIRALGPYGSALADAWQSKNVQGESWFNALNKGLQEQLDLQSQIKSVEEQRKALAESLVPTWEQLTQAASRYGFDLTELGTQVQQLGSTETFKVILEDLDLFGRATDDVGAYLSRMSGQISVAVQQALRFGTEVTVSMRPYIEELARTGQLLDENGEAITDLSALRWGPAVQTQADLVREAIEKLNETFDNLTAKLDALLDKLANGLPDAAARGARGANVAISTIEGPEHRGGAVDEASGYHLGGPVYANRGLFIPRGTDTVPAMLSPGEFVMSAAATRRLGVGTLKALNNGSGVGGVNVTINVAGYLDSQIARAHLASTVASELGRELRQRRRA